MKTPKSWRWLPRRRSFPEGGAQGGHGFKSRQFSFIAVMCIVTLFIVYKITNYQYQQTEVESRLFPFGGTQEFSRDRLNSLPHGIIHGRSDFELKPLWESEKSINKVNGLSHHHLLAMAVGALMKNNVDLVVRKFLSANFTIVLFHYDGNTNAWSDLDWNDNAIHIVAQNQTKWWFAKRFLHPDVVSIYDYIFLWDEDLGVEQFDPGRYLDIVRTEGLEISQPALDHDSLEIHHRITIRNKGYRFHRRVYDYRGSLKCTSSSRDPPCTGWVEGMAPVFSRAAWHCVWHLIQNDLVHGWGLDLKLGYCAQGDRTKKVGVVDSEYILHKGIKTLGGSTRKKPSDDVEAALERVKKPMRKFDSRIMKPMRKFNSRIAIRRQASSELRTFEERWENAVQEDKTWVDPDWNWNWNWLDTFAYLKSRLISRRK